MALGVVGVWIVGWLVLAVIVALTVASAVAAWRIKDVKQARETSEVLKALRAFVAVVFVLGVTVAPFKRGLTHRGVPDLLAWPLTIAGPLILAWLFLGLVIGEKELGFGGSAVVFVLLMVGMGYYLGVAGGWDLADKFFGVP